MKTSYSHLPDYAKKRFATDRHLNTGKSASLRNDYPVWKLRQGNICGI